MNQLINLTKNHQRKLTLPTLCKKDIILLIMTVFCQRAGVVDAFPFGISLFLALATSKNAYFYFVCVLAGALFGNASFIKYLFASVVVLLFKLFSKNDEENLLKGFGISFLSLITGGLYLVFLRNNYILDLSYLFLEIIACFVFYLIFKNIPQLFLHIEKNEPVPKDLAISQMIFLGVFIWGLSGIYLPFSVNVKTVVCIYLILCTTMYANLPTSCAFSLVLGFIAYQNSALSLSCAGIFGISSLFASLLKRLGHIGVAIGFLSGVLLSLFYAGDIGFLPFSVADIFICSLLFAILPSKINQYTGIFIMNTFQSNKQRRDFRIKEYITQELDSFSNTLSEFSRQFKNSFSKTPDTLKISKTSLFDEVAERICANCNRFSSCWQKNFNDTYRYMFSIYNTIEKDGFCDISSLPLVFSQKCIQPELFLNEFSHVYEINRRDLIKDGENTIKRSFVSNQYKEISQIIKNLSQEIEGNFFFDEKKEQDIILLCQREGIYIRDLNVVKDKEGYYQMFFAPSDDEIIMNILKIAQEVFNTKMKRVYCKNKSIIKFVTDDLYVPDVYVYQSEKEGEEICGDTVTHFRTDKNKYYIILCDGMGSGSDASKESKMTSELLAGFLKAGFSKNTAISLINSTLALKMDREGFSTIDLCEIDLRSGKTSFLKIGGAKSYVMKNNEIEVIKNDSLPAGLLEEINENNITTTLGENDIVLMVSDGICEAGYGLIRGEWIKPLIKESLNDLQNLSKKIVKNARKKLYPKPSDDMSCVTVVLRKREENNEEILSA